MIVDGDRSFRMEAATIPPMTRTIMAPKSFDVTKVFMEGKKLAKPLANRNIGVSNPRA